MTTPGLPNTWGYLVMHVGKCKHHWESLGQHYGLVGLTSFGHVTPSFTPLQPSTSDTPCDKRAPEALQLYSPLQPSTALYSSTALHALQYTSLYNHPQGEDDQETNIKLTFSLTNRPKWHQQIKSAVPQSAYVSKFSAKTDQMHA